MSKDLDYRILILQTKGKGFKKFIAENMMMLALETGFNYFTD